MLQTKNSLQYMKAIEFMIILIVFPECFVSKEAQVYKGPHGSLAEKADPFVMAIITSQESFLAGVLRIRPLKEKPEQLNKKGTLVSIL